MAKSKEKTKNRSSPEIQAFFWAHRWQRAEKNKTRSSLEIQKEKKKVTGRMTIKSHELGKMPWLAISGPEVTDPCSTLLTYTLKKSTVIHNAGTVIFLKYWTAAA